MEESPLPEAGPTTKFEGPGKNKSAGSLHSTRRGKVQLKVLKYMAFSFKKFHYL